MSRTIVVPGRPYPQGSLRPIPLKNGKVVTPQTPTVLLYRNDIRAAWGEPKVHVGPVSVDVKFVFRRPLKHYKGSSLRAEYANARLIQPPDLDKLVRAVLDALTGYAYLDDSQVYEVRASKSWSDTGADFTGITVTAEAL